MHNNIGNARREYADRHGKFTQEDAAAFFEVSLSTYKKWEQGQGKMNGAQLRAIAEKYETTVDFLLNRTPKYSYAVISFETPEEQELLSLFRRVDDVDKAKVISLVRDYADLGDAKKKREKR